MQHDPATSSARSAAPSTGDRDNGRLPQAAHAPSAFRGRCRTRGTTSEQGEIHFGYFESGPGLAVRRHGRSSACLSQDVIAREVTNAIVHGHEHRVRLGGNQDVAALHEGFADLIALFQHFSESDVLREQIGAIRGDLEERNQLGAVAPQFGQAIGQPDGVQKRVRLHRRQRERGIRAGRTRSSTRQEVEPHARGDLLVGAVFEAFKKIYESRVADLRRIATQRHRRAARGLSAPRSRQPVHQRGGEVRAPRARHVHARARLHAAGGG